MRRRDALIGVAVEGRQRRLRDRGDAVRLRRHGLGGGLCAVLAGIGAALCAATGPIKAIEMREKSQRGASSPSYLRLPRPNQAASVWRHCGHDSRAEISGPFARRPLRIQIRLRRQAKPRCATPCPRRSPRPGRIPAIDRHADRLQSAGDRRARAPRLRLHGAPPALPVPGPAADGRLRQDRDHARAGSRAARRGRLHEQAARLSRLHRLRAAARHRGDPGHRRDRRLRRVLGRGADQRAQGAGLPRHHHQRLDPRHPAGRAGLPDAGRLDRAVACLRPCGRLRPQREHPRHGGDAAAT